MKDAYEYEARRYEIAHDYLDAVKHNAEPDFIALRIQPSMYHTALKDFMKFGSITRFPEKHIYKWKNYTLDNICYLSTMTDIGGHSSHFPYDIFNDVFFYNQETGVCDEETYDYSRVCEIFEKYNEDSKFPLFSNNQYLLSDFAIEPLEKLASELMETSDVNKIIVLLNKVLDISHQRSDLAELFIQGGSDSLYEISN